LSAETIPRAASPVDFETYGDYTGASKRLVPADRSGEFNRPVYRFQGRLTADGSSGFRAEPGRYHLYISWACPWATRAAIVRELKGLRDVVSLSVVDPVRDGRGWAFREGDGHGLDEVNGFTFLSEAYEATEPGYDGHMSVPVLWDREKRMIVSNNFPDITIDLDTAFEAWADTSVELYPVELRAEIDAVNAWVYRDVNNGVYRSGFATTQEAYERAVTAVFEALDVLENRLADRRYLFGDQVTESDVRLWVTLVRFDAVYYSHFKANLRRISDYPNLWAYARDLYRQPAFRSTTNFDHIKRHYYMTHPHLNPSRVVPLGPLQDWDGADG
jgi:glutathionyl-hydroquinone reductase